MLLLLLVQLLAEAKLKFSIDFDGAAVAKFPSIAEKLLSLMKARKLNELLADLIAGVDNAADDQHGKRELSLF